ncbi:MAG: SpoIID/LytB domain-containing protein [Eubacteriales bacterium]|nr:SpoIID/LytB domain-containing protein [Eubacteriales bacterium]
MKRKIIPGFTGILWMYLIPYLCTVTVNGAETALINRKFDVELILPAVVASQISDDYELETIKAQAVISRSEFYRRSETEEKRKILQEICEKLHPTYYLLHINSSLYEKAVADTAEKVLTLQEKLKLLPYHEISAGRTRDGEDTLKSSEYSYLKSVESKMDKNAEEYFKSTYIKARQMPENLKIEKRDQAEYVTELLADGKKIEGEAFRQGLGLSSSNFTIQKIGDELRFLCKGKGHGLGFSQYGGNELVKKGSTYAEILEIYFPGMKITDIGEVK